MTTRSTGRRALLLTSAALGLSPLFTGCASPTAASVRHERRPAQPVRLQALHVLFVETSYQLTGERPYLSSGDVNGQRAQWSAAFRRVFPQAMQAAGVPASVRSLPGPLDPRSAEFQAWFAARPAAAHALIVTPHGGRVFCTGGPCNFRFGADMRLLAPDGQPVWTAQLQQPDMTPSLKPGRDADYEHFTREMARALLQETTAGATKP